MAAMPLEYFERNGRRMVRLIEPPPESTPVTREWLEECERRQKEEIRQRRLKEKNEDRFTRHMREQDRIFTELRYKGQIARSLVNKGFPRSALQVDLRQGLDHLEDVESLDNLDFWAPNSNTMLSERPCDQTAGTSQGNDDAADESVCNTASRLDHGVDSAEFDDDNSDSSTEDPDGETETRR